MSSRVEKTREKILRSTWRLLEAGDPNAVRMSDIAKAAGVSRQAVYLHFPSRAELLIATTRYIDQAKDVDARLAPSRSAETGKERLEAYIEGWCNYVPEIHGVGKALMAMAETDGEAKAAWNDRMSAMREGCEAAVAALERDGKLAKELSLNEAAEFLWALLSVRNYENLRIACGWSQERYVWAMQEAARRMLIAA